MPENLNHLTEAVIGAAIEIHRALGPGLLESVYERAMGIELNERGIPFETQVQVPIITKANPLVICDSTSWLINDWWWNSRQSMCWPPSIKPKSSPTCVPPTSLSAC